MLYKFKSKATSDVIMLEPNGRQILQIWGKFEEGAPAKGILLPEDMPAAKAALEAAIATEEAQRAQTALEAQDRGEDTHAPAGVSLRQRATPLLDMLQRSQKAQKEIVWGT
ncbi:DUF1840 domain-containing protein [Rhodoferax saidenbachensis]|uniref:Cyclopropane-fatty-acyl-phospholipid synthase n=1 Tax=Rhodoferax saidenbachensis TaxID=1484693 RepID=A0ABU1ZKI9_9BURK|nr:DUF1840 domain-containing protein [Rhodoferax saidenbachensis]MDR7306067.1 cyclopropane-fatty-acyl-phospholipid synthase [Rhodoferax saidenbachensis]